MWLKSDNTRNRSYLINLENAHCIEMSCCRDCCSVNAYFNHGGSVDGYLNEIELLEGTRKECEDYMEWIQGELAVRNDVIEYHPAKVKHD